MRILTVEKKNLKRVIRIPTFAPEMFFQIKFEVIFSIHGYVWCFVPKNVDQYKTKHTECYESYVLDILNFENYFLIKNCFLE